MYVFRLGLILGAKIFVDFTKYSFDMSIEKLNKELVQTNVIVQSDLSEKSIINTTSTESCVRNWPNAKVLEWLKKSGIDAELIDGLKNFDGEMLYELTLIRNSAPEFFFNSISQQNRIKLDKVVHLSSLLKKLNF